MSERNKRYYEKHRDEILVYQREKQRQYREAIKDDAEKMEARRLQQRNCKARQRQKKVQDYLDAVLERRPELHKEIAALKLIPTLTEHQADKAIAAFKASC